MHMEGDGMSTATTAALSTRTVGEVVAEDYARASVFRRLGIDFCCGGGRTVGKACEQVGVPVEELERQLAAADRSGRSGMVADPRRWDPDLLADYIVRMHHRYVRESLPVLLHFSDKVARVHGGRHPELVELRELVGELAAEMEEHMEREEVDLFPGIGSMVARIEGREDSGDSFQAWGRGALGLLQDDHERAGELMSRIRATTDDYRPPTDACNTYRATFAKLQEFEEDLHLHVHLENNVLFPQVQRMLEGVGA
jgi:regulator of cell morphogenesis and NO signaling